uniref:Uncharacterized protein n=1 Tax=Manihot esculenta TaxID=3983 RepID=A0A2C9UKZ2_MANES
MLPMIMLPLQSYSHLDPRSLGGPMLPMTLIECCFLL